MQRVQFFLYSSQSTLGCFCLIVSLKCLLTLTFNPLGLSYHYASALSRAAKCRDSSITHSFFQSLNKRLQNILNLNSHLQILKSWFPLPHAPFSFFWSFLSFLVALMYGVERSMLPGFSLYGNVSQALNHSLLSTNRHDLFCFVNLLCSFKVP